MTSDTGFDVLVIGSGFGGSVAALRLTEKGYRVGVLEAGRRFAPAELPATTWRLRDFLWAPRLGMFGPQRISVLRDVWVMSAAGVGGGSLIYGNTLYLPPESFFTDRQWSGLTDWQAELAPFYDQARRMLGAVTYPRRTAADEVLAAVGTELGVGDSFRPTDVGVFLGEPGRRVPDPYFGGAGPDRTGCLHCGSCFTGCRYGAKNTTTVNYLYLAEQAGAEVHPMTTVTAVRPSGAGYAVDTVPTGRRAGRAGTTRYARHVVFAAGTLGTQRLLHELRDSGVLPRVSPRLGELTRTNSEAILGATARPGGVRFNDGVAITSSLYPDPDTHVEVCRYGPGSNLFSLLATLLVDGGGRLPRPVRFLAQVARHPGEFARSLSARGWSDRTVVLLVMQSRDNSITVYRRPARLGPAGLRALPGSGWLLGPRLTSRPGHGEPNPTWIPAGHEVSRRIAERIGGFASGTVGDLVNVPMTGHLLGGCPIGADPGHGVIDAYQRLYGHPGLHVVDASAVSANLGVNPALTITAQAERAMAFWPNKGEPDPRPPLGARYRRLAPVAPSRPAVPAHAPAAQST